MASHSLDLSELGRFVTRSFTWPADDKTLFALLQELLTEHFPEGADGAVAATEGDTAGVLVALDDEVWFLCPRPPEVTVKRLPRVAGAVLSRSYFLSDQDVIHPRLAVRYEYMAPGIDSVSFEEPRSHKADRIVALLEERTS